MRVLIARLNLLLNSLRRYWLHAISRLLRPVFALKPVWYLSIPGEMLFLAERGLEPKFVKGV